MNEATTTLIVQKTFFGNPSAELNPLQLLLEPHLELFATLWLLLWISIALFVFYKLFKSFQEYRHPR